jgi:Fe-S-cluster containining protein
LNCFYEEGLRFTCQSGCHYCCAVEPGFVFLNKEDIARLSNYLMLSQKEFVLNYCREVPFGSISYISLNEHKNHDCVFLEPTGCGVYPARPVQCATYPFWSTILHDYDSWLKEKKWCPGIDEGKLHTKEEIDKNLLLRQKGQPAVWQEIVN